MYVEVQAAFGGKKQRGRRRARRKITICELLVVTSDYIGLHGTGKPGHRVQLVAKAAGNFNEIRVRRTRVSIKTSRPTTRGIVPRGVGSVCVRFRGHLT